VEQGRREEVNKEKEPLLDEMFRASTRFSGTFEEFMKALNDAGYWGDASLSTSEKEQHVLDKKEDITLAIVEWIKNNLSWNGEGDMRNHDVKRLAEKGHAEQWNIVLVEEAIDRLIEDAAEADETD
jgi:hypothetical protein